MGADLIMAWLIHDKDISPNWDAGRAKLQEIAEHELKTDPNGLYDEDTSLEDVYVAGDGPEITLADSLESIDYLEEANKNGQRDFSSVTLGHFTMLMSGGISWGDDPTESFTHLDRMGRLPAEVLTEMGFYTGNIPDYKEYLNKVLDLHPEILPTLPGLDPEFDGMIEARLKEV